MTTTIIPLFLKCFDCPAKLKLLAFKKVEYLSKKMEYQFVKAKIIPKVVMIMKDTDPEVRKNSLIALWKLLSILDGDTITHHVLPGL